MARVLAEIDDELAKWIAAQHIYFVGSAPLTADGHVNVSPRGLDSLRVLGPHEVAFYDLTGSGNETAAHLAENGRITIMFCAFEGKPRILRLYGKGQVIRPDDAGWEAARRHFPAEMPPARQIIRVAVSRVQTSCGFGVPMMQFERERDELVNWASNKNEEDLTLYQQRNNAQSIDGLLAPGIRPLK